MGRQLGFYMLPADHQFFFRSIRQFPDVKIIHEHPKERHVEEVDEIILSRIDRLPLIRVLIWDSQLPILPEHLKTAHLQKYDEEAMIFITTGEKRYYVEKLEAPVIEFHPSVIKANGEVDQGRIWIETRHDDLFLTFYEKIVRFIKKNFYRIKGNNGYFGPELFSLYKKGKITVTYYGCYIKQD